LIQIIEGEELASAQAREYRAAYAWVRDEADAVSRSKAVSRAL